MGALAVAFARLLHPERGVFATYARQPHRRTFKRLQPLWYPLLVLYPAALGILALIGYLYTAGTLSILLLDTAWFLVELILFYGFFGLWVLWSDLFPALRILDQVTLWQHTLTVDGEPQVLPITLASVGLALFYGVITVILAKQLPTWLAILLLKLTEMGAGGRYTVTTLTNYLVVTTGAVLVFKTIGADWSQLQWLVAALGVGIGFGLQEIVANFISGIIVLFERPIRIGDNALGLLLRGFVDSTDLRFPTVSALNQAINDKFNAAGIVIAFPQRDLHLHTSQPLQVELRGMAGLEPSDRT